MTNPFDGFSGTEGGRAGLSAFEKLKADKEYDDKTISLQSVPETIPPVPNPHPDFVIDVSDFMEQKILAVKAFSSQFYNPKSQEPHTIISSQGFLDSIRYRAADLGRLSGVDYAEGFTVEKLPVLNLLDDLS